MKCPECQFDNREEAKFCSECGYKFEITCPKCKHKIRPGSKFCDECGCDLSHPKEAPSIDYSKPQSYTPKFLADKILTSRSSLEGERKLVTVLFADVANYTAMSEKLDPEEVHQIMDGCFAILMDKIHHYEGTINQFTGDGVMALFGAPVAHEEHAQRACRAALAIQRAIDSYGDKINQDCGVDFSMRMGLNSGPVIVGAIGDDLRMDYTAIGDTTNVAMRMQTLSKPGTILISENTHRLVKAYFDFEACGPLAVKGKQAPQNAYRLITSSDVQSRFDASVSRGLVKFVGRRNSMAAFKNAWDKACSGSGQVLGVVGEAGVGKSRLLLEFRRSLLNDPVTYLEGRCLHYGGSMPYLPFLEILRHFFGIDEDQREYVGTKNIKNRLQELDQYFRTDSLAVFQNLFSFEVEDETWRKLESNQKRERTFEALRNLFILASEKKPLVVAVEDLQWIDKTSEAFLSYLIDSMAQSRILLILLNRPDYSNPWHSKTYFNKVGLTQLTSESSAELVSAILQDGEVGGELKELILNRTAGNPLFMEEFTHSLLESGWIEKRDNRFVLRRKLDDLQVPDTIQGIIAARMDRLEDNLKRTMQVASVIGRDFAFRILQAITGMKQELKSHLINLQGLEFIYEKSLFPELEYIFKHILTQEVAYNSLLLKRRKRIHEKIAKAIEELYMERLEEFYEILAYHYSKSDIAEKAISYWHLAGRRALRLFAMDEALDHFANCIKIIEELPAGDTKRDLKIEIGTKLSFTYLMKNKYAKATEIVKPLEKLATENKHQKNLGRIYTSIGINLVMNTLDIENGIRYLKKSIALSKKTNDMPALSFGTTYLAGSYLNCGKLDAAESTNNQIIPLLEEKRSWYTLTVPYTIMSQISCEKGDAESADKWSRKAYKCIEKYNDSFTQSWGNLAMGHLFLQKGNLDEAEKKLMPALNNAKKISLHVVIEPCLLYLGQLYIKKEDNDSGLKYINELKDMIEHKESPLLYLCNCLVIEAMICIHMNKFDKAFNCLERALKFKVPIYEGILYRIFGDYYRELGTDYFQSSQEWYEKAIHIDGRIGKNLELARDYFSYGEMLKRQCKLEEASKRFNDALAIFNAFGAAWDIDQVEEAKKDA